MEETTDLPDSLRNPAVVVLEIGDPGRLSRRYAAEMARLIHHAAHQCPDATLVVTLGGFDDDPRSLWDIREARKFLKAWAAEAGIRDWWHPLVMRLSVGTIALLAKCGAFAPGHPFVPMINDAVPLPGATEYLRLDQADLFEALAGSKP